jgi:hypothetical protein
MQCEPLTELVALIDRGAASCKADSLASSIVGKSSLPSWKVLVRSGCCPIEIRYTVADDDVREPEARGDLTSRGISEKPVRRAGHRG